MNNITHNKKFYIYELWNPLNHKPFYVGMGSTPSKRYNDHIREANKNYSKKDSNMHKLNTIKKIHRMGYNVDIRLVYETNIKSKAIKYEINLISQYGRKTINGGLLTNISPGGEGGFTKKHTPEWKQHLKENNAGGKATRKSIYQININGTIIKEWKSCSEAARYFNVGRSNINICCVHKKYWKCKGFYWRFTTDEDYNIF